MKTCVLTENFACAPNVIWQYLTRPTLNHWRTDVTQTETAADGMSEVQTHADGSTTQVIFTRREQNRALCCDFTHGRWSGRFTAILLGSGTTSLECTFEIDGLGMFDKAHKHLQPVLDMLKEQLERNA